MRFACEDKNESVSFSQTDRRGEGSTALDFRKDAEWIYRTTRTEGYELALKLIQERLVTITRNLSAQASSTASGPTRTEVVTVPSPASPNPASAAPPLVAQPDQQEKS